MNIHYLELFYHVAKHGGIAAAVRRMPYGIQQPAVSGQIARLEEALGGRLFERRPFRLLPSGIQLFEFVSPFFDHLDEIELTIRSGSSPQLRIAAPAVVLEQYLPEILERVRPQFPQFRLSLHEAGRAEAERLLSAGEVDVAVLVLERKARSELPSRALLELPLVLLVPAQHPVKTARQLWRDNPVRETLICFPRRDPIQVLCQEGLHRAGVEWFPGIEVSSTRLIECYVARGVRDRCGGRYSGVSSRRPRPDGRFARISGGGHRCSLVAHAIADCEPVPGRNRSGSSPAERAQAASEKEDARPPGLI